MDYYLLAILALATFALVLGFAFWSKRKTENTHHDTKAEKSSLAKDGPGPQPIRPAGDETTSPKD